MKILLLSSLLLTTPIFAQNLSLSALKEIMTAKKETLETVRIGMSKKLTTTARVEADGGACDYTLTSIQSILKVEGDKLVVLAKESFIPAATTVCQLMGYEAFDHSILYYEARPTLQQDLKDLDESASAIKSITKSGDLIIISMAISETDPETNTTFSDNVILKYDFNKSSFNNLSLIQGNGYSTTSQDLVDIDLTKVDLRNVFLCENNDGDYSDCAQGDYSDILY